MSILADEEQRAMLWRQGQVQIAQKVSEVLQALVPPAAPAAAVYANYLPLQIAKETREDNDNGGYYDTLNSNAG